MSKSTPFFIASAALAFFLTACVSPYYAPELSAKFAKQTLRVGICPDFPPLIFRQNGNIDGIEANLSQRIGKILGAEIIYVEKSWNDLIPSLEKGEFDVIMSGMTATKERSERVLFTKPYKRVGQMAIMCTSNIAKFSTVEKVLATRGKVGFLQGTTGETFVKASCKNAEKVPLQNAQEAESYLLNGKIDLFISDAPVIWVMSSSDLTPLCVPLTEEYLAWAVRKNDTRLASILDACLDKMKADSYLSEVESAWVPEFIRNAEAK